MLRMANLLCCSHPREPGAFGRCARLDIVRRSDYSDRATRSVRPVEQEGCKPAIMQGRTLANGGPGGRINFEFRGDSVRLEHGSGG